MKSSSIISIDNDRFLFLKESYKNICNGNDCAAILLNFLVYRHDTRLTEIEAKEAHTNFKRKLDDLLIEASNNYLSDSLMNLYNEKYIRQTAKPILQSLGFISIYKVKNKGGGLPCDAILVLTENLNKTLTDYAQNRYKYYPLTSGQNTNRATSQAVKSPLASGEKSASQAVKSPTYKSNKSLYKSSVKSSFKKETELENEQNRTEPFLEKEDFEQNLLEPKEPEQLHTGGAAIEHDDTTSDDLFFLQKFKTVSNFKTAAS